MYSTTLDKHITKYCKKFGIAKATCSDEFAYFPATETLTYTIFQFTTDKPFIELINKKYNVNIAPFYFIFSLLHEIGHHITFDELTDEEMENELFARTVIPCLNENEQMEAYINLAAEDMATSWAIDYIDSHLKECWETQKRFMQIIDHIYKKKSFQKVLTKLT